MRNYRGNTGSRRCGGIKTRKSNGYLNGRKKFCRILEEALNDYRFFVSFFCKGTDPIPVDRNHSQFRANNCVVFMVENTFRLALYTATGIMTMDVVKNAVCLLPFMAAGLGIGIFFEKHIPERQAKRCVILLLILSGLSLIGTNLAITGA